MHESPEDGYRPRPRALAAARNEGGPGKPGPPSDCVAVELRGDQDAVAVRDELAVRERGLDRFVECERKVRAGYQLRVSDIRVVHVYQERTIVPGTNLIVPSTAVKLRYRISINGGTAATDSFTGHAVSQKGRWYWLLDEAAMCAYKRGDCPSL